MRVRVTRAMRAAAVAALAGLSALPATATAKAPAEEPFYGSSLITPVAPGEKMLVEADQIVYDHDRNTVAAVGNVTIYYGRYTLTAERVTYNQTSGRLIAQGRVRMVDPTGAEFRSDYFDITDNFRDGFVQSLKVDTPQRTHFTAERAERANGETVTFVNGAYTACETCAEHPERPPLWNVRAAKIVVDQKEHMVHFTDARLEFFGLPVAWLPVWSMPDPSVKRKSGFLTPSVGFSDTLGVSAGIPYFWAIAPNKDITFAPAYYTRQGFMAAAEWRHRLQNGEYSVAAAGINQSDKDAFDPSASAYRELRGGVRTTGEFYLNRNWTFGWDGTLLSDRTFTRDYKVLSRDTSETTSTVHLTGLGDRNYFEARASAFQILTEPSAAPVGNPGKYDQGRQAFAVPTIDYKRYANVMPAGGELKLTTNVTTLVRADDDPFMVGPDTYYAGTAGTTLRATQAVEWQRQVIGPGGQVVTPFASLRGDAFYLSGQSAAAIADGLTSDSTAFRAMPAAGLEWSLPVLLRSAGATQIVEPKAQLILRPNEMAYGTLPNNDAQSLVFEQANLFDRDKFGGFDRNEGGGRLNVGIHYSGAFANGASVDGTFGQSFQIFGANPYAGPTYDLADVGRSSGLETRRSDYVGSVTFDSGVGPRIAARGRFDEATLAVKRAEIEATAALGPVTASATYFYASDNPNNDVNPGPASVVHGAASVNLATNWRAFGSVAYDLGSAAVASNSFGFAFDNQCITLSVAYSQTRENYTDLQPDRWINFRVELRTLGEGAINANLNTVN